MMTYSSPMPPTPLGYSLDYIKFRILRGALQAIYLRNMMNRPPLAAAWLTVLSVCSLALAQPVPTLQINAGKNRRHRQPHAVRAG